MAACSVERSPQPWGSAGSGGVGAGAADTDDVVSPADAFDNGTAGTSSRTDGFDAGAGTAGQPAGAAGMDATGPGTADAPGGTPRGAELGATGAPCGQDADCSAAGPQGTCFAESTLSPLLTLPGGYCTMACGTDLRCEGDDLCVVIPLGSFPLPICMRTCVDDGDCRMDEGYTCNVAPTGGGSVCSLPN